MLKRIRDELFGYRDLRIENMNYDEYWKYRKKHGKQGLKKRDIIISELIEDSSTVLDVGCGNGRLLEHLINKKNVIGEGIDVSNTALDMARSKGISIKKVDFDKESLSLNKLYDHIVMSEVVEHISNPEKLVSQVQNHFSKSLIITFPNIGHFTYRLRLLMGRFPECWKWHPGEHIRFWTKKDFRYWIKREDNKFCNLYIKRFIPGERSPNVPFFDSLTALNYIVVLGRKND